MALEVKGLQKSDLKLGSTTTHGVEVADRASLTPSSRRPLEQRTPAYPPFMLLIEVCCMEVVREDAMKIGQGQLDTSQLIERMQKAHAESKEVKGSGASFALDAAGAPATESAPASGIERSVLEIAERVLNGELSDPSATRREVLEAIVDDKFGAMVEPSQKRRTLEMLEFTLGEDPAFSREVDDMLVLAARSLADRG